jgi:hypothetical protein
LPPAGLRRTAWVEPVVACAQDETRHDGVGWVAVVWDRMRWIGLGLGWEGLGLGLGLGGERMEWE